MLLSKRVFKGLSICWFYGIIVRSVSVTPAIPMDMLHGRSRVVWGGLKSQPWQLLSLLAPVMWFPLWSVPGHAEGRLCEQALCAEVPWPGDHHRGVSCQGERLQRFQKRPAWHRAGELAFFMLLFCCCCFSYREFWGPQVKQHESHISPKVKNIF